MWIPRKEDREVEDTEKEKNATREKRKCDTIELKFRVELTYLGVKLRI